MDFLLSIFIFQITVTLPVSAPPNISLPHSKSLIDFYLPIQKRRAPPGPSSARSRVGWLENRFPSSPASGGRVGRPGSPASPREGRSFPEEASRTERRHRLVNAGPRSGWCVNRIAVNHVASESYRHRAVDSLVKGKPLCWENTPHLFQLSSEFLSSVLFLDDLFCPCNPPLPTYWNG